jgi:hypothetical protein
MSPDDRITREARHCADITNLAWAMMRAQDFDAVGCATGVCIMATVMIGSDPAARTALATEMLRLARELDPDLIDARWQ